MRLSVFHTVASLHPDAGGPSRTVSATSEALGKVGIETHLLTQHQSEDEILSPSTDQVSLSTVDCTPSWFRPVRYYRSLVRMARTRNIDLLHDHGVWLPTNLASALAAARLDVPLVVTTRGMLEPWALNHQKWKKRVAWYGYQRWILQQVELLHATAPMEAEHLRELGVTAPIAVIPNGVPLPQRWKQQASDGPERQALFLSRIHPKKGLPMLLDAWVDLRPKNWRLLIVGPDENDHRAALNAQVRDLGLRNSVEFRGPVSDDQKWPLYRESDLFVLPTHSENFGVVVAEALASGIPALTTTGAPWSMLEEKECGWWVEPNRNALKQALSDAINRSDEERLAMGQRGRQLVKDQFAWSSVAEKMKTAYQWVLGTGPRPDHVQTCRTHDGSGS